MSTVRTKYRDSDFLIDFPTMSQRENDTDSTEWDMKKGVVDGVQKI